MLTKTDPEHAKFLLKQAQADVALRWKLYEHMANMPGTAAKTEITRFGVRHKRMNSYRGA